MALKLRCCVNLARPVWSRQFCQISSQVVGNAEINANGANAVVFGGFGFGKRQMAKHEALYTEHGFSITPVLASPFDLSSPAASAAKGRELAKAVMKQDKNVVIHTISGSFWTMIYMLHNMDRDWRDERVKAIMFDSSPPKSDIHAFGGWLSFATKQPWAKQLSFMFYPYRMYQGINDKWEAENHARMFGAEAVIPRGAHCLVMRGRNDPVLDAEYVDDFIADLKQHANKDTNVQEINFEKARHAMAVVESPSEYKAVHINKLLAMVPEWRVGSEEGMAHIIPEIQSDASILEVEYLPSRDHKIVNFA